MFIKKIALENIRSYKKEEISFSSGSTLLWGEIGSGKSTILYAIEFALFGIIKGINSYSQLLRHGQTQGLIRLTLAMRKPSQQQAEETYIIERHIKKSSKGKFSSSVSIIVDGRKKDLSTSELRHFIHELLGYPTEDVSRKFMLFRYSVYTPQEEMKQILLDDPESRIATLRKIFDLDRYKHIKDNVLYYAWYINKQINYHQGKAEGLTEKNRLLEEYLKKRKENEAQYAFSKEKLSKEESVLSEAKEQLRVYEEKFEKRTALMNTKASLTSELQTKQTNRTDIQQAQTKEDATLQKQLTLLVEKEKTVVSECNNDCFSDMNLATYRLGVEKGIAAYNTFLLSKTESHLMDADKTKSYTSLQKTLQESTQTFQELQTLLSERKKKVQDEQKSYEAEREKKRDEREQKENEIIKLQTTINALDQGTEKNTQRFQADVNSELVRRQEQEVTSLRDEIAEKQKQIEEKQRKGEALSKSIQTYDLKTENAQSIIQKITELSSCPTCLQTVTDEYKQNVLTVQQEVIENAKRVVTELTLSQKTLQQDETTLKNELDQLQKKQLNLHTAYEQNKKTLAENKKVAQEIQTDRERIVQAKKVLDERIAERDKFKQSQDELNEKKRHAYDQSIKHIEHTLEEIQETIYTLKDMQRILTGITERDVTVSSLTEQITAVQKRLKTVDQSIQELVIDAETIKQHREKVDAIKERASSIRVQLAELKKDKEYTDEQITSIQNEIDEKRKEKEEFDFLSSIHSWLTDYFTKLTDVIERHVFLTIYQEFNESFRKWFDILMDSAEITVQLDSQFTPLISINGYDAEYQHLSGGEKTAIALSYRIALNEILHRTFSGIKTRDLIILDEPTDGFSYQQIDRIQDLFEQINCNQIIVVSHETKIESYVDTIIRVQKENHVSQVTY